jgi:transcriptional antiterminator
MKRKIFIDSATWTSEKLAEELGISVRQVRNHISKGNLAAEALHSGRSLLIRHHAAQKFVTDYKSGAFPVGKHK